MTGVIFFLLRRVHYNIGDNSHEILGDEQKNGIAMMQRSQGFQTAGSQKSIQIRPIVETYGDQSRSCQ